MIDRMSSIEYLIVLKKQTGSRLCLSLRTLTEKTRSQAPKAEQMQHTPMVEWQGMTSY